MPRGKSLAGEVKAIIDLLKQDYALDPGSIEYLLDEAEGLADMTDGPVRVACGALEAGSQLTAAHRRNISAFARRAAQDVHTKRCLEKAARRKGRCPRTEKAWLRKEVSACAEIAAPPRRPRGSPTLTSTLLDLADVTGSITELPEVIDRLSCLDKNADMIEIKLGEFTYASALAVLAQWILHHDFVEKYEFSEVSRQTEQYLERLNFENALTDREIRIEPSPLDWAVGITRINKDLPTHIVTEKIVDILDTFMAPKPEDRSTLSILVTEMIENVHMHARVGEDGFAVAQVYPRKLKIGITLVDAGIGVKESFGTESPSFPTGDLTRDGDFLQHAVKMLSTSKESKHSGYGLYLIREVVARNRGTFSLTSGGATLVSYRRKGAIQNEIHEHGPWQGTIISVILDLTNSLPLDDIYSEMPPIPGYEDEDFFEK